MRWLWVWLLVSVTVVLGGAWVLFRFLVDLNQLSQLSGVGSLAAGVGALATAVWTARRASAADDGGTASTPTPRNSGTTNTVTGNVSGTLIQAHTIEGGVGDTSHDPVADGHEGARDSERGRKRRHDG
ncbi:hypothetical protein [Nocardiopsis quinghaiensis]|uniref:hypothetical protein n=1 Tax=Nocardiopsis quinghaiensis TaxID=464995 RepID=UPI001238C4BB|nr:hypothetical protein [Nocardiopsis quinghaiensis]